MVRGILLVVIDIPLVSILSKFRGVSRSEVELKFDSTRIGVC